MKKLRNILFLLPVVCIGACKDEYTICTQSKNVNFIAGFYRNINGVPQATTAPSLSVYLLNVTPPVYSHVENAPSFSVPLSPVTDTSRFVIAVSNSSQTDTLTLIYTTQDKQLSPECGNVSVNNITGVNSTNHSIQSVSLMKQSVNTDGALNLRIFLY